MTARTSRPPPPGDAVPAAASNGTPAGAWRKGGVLVLAAVLAAAPAVAQPAPAEGAPGRVASRGSAILLEQANYWSAQGRPQLAQQALDRLLLLEPSNPDVLAAATEVAAQNGDRGNAENYLGRLNQIAPGSIPAQRAATVLRAMMVDQAVLAEARRLSQAGQREAAMQRYRELFPNGEVPSIFASEYYQTLAGISPESFEEAKQGMERVVRLSTDNRALQLAYAQMLTYNDVHRPDGIVRLRQLADVPAVGAAARAAWRQALLWMPTDPDTADAIASFFRTNPADPELQARYDEAKATIIPQWVAERLAGWDAIAAGRVADAERNFTAAREGDPSNAEAVIGMVIVRKLQFRFPEARALFAEAVSMAPDRRDEFAEKTGSLEGYPAPGAAKGNQGGARGLGGASVSPGHAALAWQNLNRNALDRAADHARRALSGNAEERVQGELVLGLVAIRQNDFSTAETRFRTALSIKKNDAAAQGGLFEALQRQGRFAEADRLLAETGFRPPAGSQAFRSAALRQEAQRTQNLDARISLLRGALAADPSSAWAAFDLARSLKERGQVEEARRLERELAARNVPDALFAAALLSNADGRLAETVDRLGAIPSNARPEEGNRLLERNRRAIELRQLEQAARGNPRSEAARRLVALAGQPDQSGETAAAVIRAFGRLRQPGNVEAAARSANAEAPSTPAQARVAIAAALLEAGRSGEAEALAATVERDPGVSGDARRQAVALRATSVATTADRLNDRGDREAALQRLAPTLSQAPDNPDVQLSLARVYAGSGRAEEASRIAEAILSSSPDNIRARAVAGEAAVARGAMGRAEQILSEGRARGADELQMALLEARIARARDDQVRARRALEQAARLRALQLRASEPSG